MSVLQYVNALALKGVELWLEEGKLKFQAPTGVITPTILAELKDKKSEIMFLLESYSGTLGTFPLSYSQQSLWSLNQLNPTSAAYNVTYAAKLRDDVDTLRLSTCLDYLVARHPILRTAYKVSEGEPVQHVTKRSSVELTVEHAENASEADILLWVDLRANKAFNLSNTPFRAEMLKNSLGNRTESILLLVVHHIAADFWSLEILIQELVKLYDKGENGQPMQLDPIGLEYQNHVALDKQFLNSNQGELLAQYWESTIPSPLTCINLKTDYPRPPLKTENGRVHLHPINNKLSLRLRELALQCHVTPYTLILSVYRFLLHILSDQKVVCIGAPTAGRDREGTEAVVGHFVNTSVIVSNFDKNLSFKEVVKETQSIMNDLLDHQGYPFPLLVERLRIARDSSRSPIFQVMYNWNKARRSTSDIFDGNNKSFIKDMVIASSTGTQGATHDLTLNIYDYGDNFEAAWTYNSDLFNMSTISQYADFFEEMLHSITLDIDRPLESFIFNSSSNGLSIEKDIVVDEARVNQAGKVKFINGLSTKYLNLSTFNSQPANKLASDFLKVDYEYGVFQSFINALDLILQQNSIPLSTLIQINIENTPIKIALSFGLAALGYRFAINYDNTEESGKLHEAGAEYVISANVNDAINFDSIEIGCPIAGINKLFLIKNREIDFDVSKNNSHIFLDRGTIFEISFNDFQSLLFQVIDRWKFDEKSQVLIDLGVPPFSELVMGAAGLLSGSEWVVDDVSSQGWETDIVPDVIFLPAHSAIWQSDSSKHAMIYELCNEISYLCDDQAPIAHLEPVSQKISSLIITQAMLSGVLLAFDWRRIDSHKGQWLLGHDLCDETGINIIDRTKRPLNINSVGNIWLNTPPNSIDTNILVRRTEYGFALYRDEYRLIENSISNYYSSEVESALLTLDKVKYCWLKIINFENKINTVLFYFTEDGRAIDDKILKKNFKKFLPDFMFPTKCMLLMDFPICNDLRIDHESFILPSINDKPEFQKPRDELERALAEIWCEVLKVDNVSVYDDFYELGGDSIMGAVIISSAMSKGLHISARDILENTTISDLALVVTIESGSGAQQGLLSGKVSLSPAQNWFFEKITDNRDHFNQALLIQLVNAPDISLLTKAVESVLIQHDLLRARFWEENDGWKQEIGTDINDENLVKSLVIGDSMIIDDVIRETQSSLNIESGQLVKVVWIEADSHINSRLLFVVHHLVIDAVSWYMVLEDLQLAYQLLLEHQVLELPKKSSAFGDWSHAMINLANSADFERDKRYWVSEFMKVDYASKASPEAHQEQYTSVKEITLSCELTSALQKEVNDTYNTSTSDILVAALVQTLRNWSNENSIIINMEGHGRDTELEKIQISRTVGWFTSIFPVLFSPVNDDIEAVLKYVKERIRSVPNKGVGYGLHRYALNSESQHHPKPEEDTRYLFNYLGDLSQTIKKGVLFSGLIEPASDSRHIKQCRTHEFVFNARIVQGMLKIECDFSHAIYKEKEVDSLLEQYILLLESYILHCLDLNNGGFTPSDMPDLDMDQIELDAILDEVALSSSN